MKILRLKAFGFRNYQHLDYRPGWGMNLLIGQNGMGKTNFLDLVHYLSTARSYFTGLDREVVCLDEDVMRLEAWLSGQKEHHLVIKWSRATGKVVEWDGVPVTKLSDHLGRFRTVFMAPQDSFVLQMGNTERRRWLDRLLCQKSSEYAQALSQYTALLQRRNAYLKNELPHKIDDVLLDQYWTQMEPHALVLKTMRSEMIDELSSTLKHYYHQISEGREEVDMLYETEWQGTWSDLSDHLRDIKFQTSKSGMHKDKIHFLINGKKLKLFASQGQTKSFFLSLKLAEFQNLSTSGNALPILLIDDVYARLDDGRTHQFFDLLLQLGAPQIFVTDTHRDRMQTLLDTMSVPGRIVQVENGNLEDVYEKEE